MEDFPYDGCPVCGQIDGVLNTPADWGYCYAHDCCWLIGAGVVINANETKKAWAANRAFLRGFRCEDENRRWLG